MTDFGELRFRGLREVWPREEASFTPWLAERLSDLGTALGMDLELQDREVRVGRFASDIVARDLNRNRMVVIENQLTPTDHDHLGKLLTYAAGLDAATVIWVAGEFREEHRQALDWLNQNTGEDVEFFGVVVEVLQIDDSRPAYHFRPVSLPNYWRKTGVAAGRGTAVTERGERYRAFFQDLIDRLREEQRFTGARVGQPQNWYAFSAGTTGIAYGISFVQGDRVRAEVYIDRGDYDTNKALFDALHAEREHIESAFGGPLEWERLNERRASRIAVYQPGSIDDGSETLQEVQEWCIDRLLRLKSAFGARLIKLAR